MLQFSFCLVLIFLQQYWISKEASKQRVNNSAGGNESVLYGNGLLTSGARKPGLIFASSPRRAPKVLACKKKHNINVKLAFVKSFNTTSLISSSMQKLPRASLYKGFNPQHPGFVFSFVQLHKRGSISLILHHKTFFLCSLSMKKCRHNLLLLARPFLGGKCS